MSGRRGDRSRVLIPAARFSEAWGNFFGEKRFAKIAGFERFGSSRGVHDGAPHLAIINLNRHRS